MIHDSSNIIKAQRTKSVLNATIGHAETMIKVYSSRDRDAMMHYEQVKVEAERELLDIITIENEMFLNAQKMEA